MTKAKQVNYNGFWLTNCTVSSQHAFFDHSNAFLHIANHLVNFFSEWYKEAARGRKEEEALLVAEGRSFWFDSDWRDSTENLEKLALEKLNQQRCTQSQ